eukprot:Rmarinus@m.13824
MSSSLPEAQNLDALIEKLMDCELPTEHEVNWICEKVKEVLIEESNVQRVSSPVTIVGDIHGQFYDLKELFYIGGQCPNTNYLFLGDYVDRGYFSVETISLLVCLKLRFPNRITLLRGNHEARTTTQTYGFYIECMKKYGNLNVWRHFTNMFDYLSITAVIDDKYLCVHGGLSPSLHALDQIRVLDRFQEVPHDGPLADLLWSDPDKDHKYKEGFHFSERGSGYVFAQDVVDKFCHDNDLQHIMRAHQLIKEGYMVLFNNKLSTVWSAPNYCYRCGNVASVLEIDDHGNFRYNVFDAAPDNERVTPKDRWVSEAPSYFS